MKTYFVTGTDTEIGKTTITAGLLYKFSEQGLSTAGLKLIASGCEYHDGQLINNDALQMQQVMSLDLPYETVNPISFEPPIAPHLAAKEVGVELSVNLLTTQSQALLSSNADVTLVEGAGGWMLPLNDNETMADFVAQKRWPVILVVGLRLGCINHALLTYHMIKAKGLNVIGWVANTVDPNMLNIQGNIETLAKRLDIPCWGQVPFLDSPKPGMVAEHLNFNIYTARG